MQSTELHQLKPENINLNNRIVYITHDPNNGQTTKTGKGRISFFTTQTQTILTDYIAYYNNGSDDNQLFPKRIIQRELETTPMQVKYLRKYFSQQWGQRV